jgi:hypothetical protein
MEGGSTGAGVKGQGRARPSALAPGPVRATVSMPPVSTPSAMTNQAGCPIAGIASA